MKFLFLFVILALWIVPSVSSLKVSISRTFGLDNSRCFHTNRRFPCRSISYALRILNDAFFDHEKIFIFSIEDKHYDLLNQVHIFQSRPERRIILTTADNFTTVIRGGSEMASFHIGSQTGKTISTYNVHISHVEFQQFSANSTAVVNVFNAINISFHNCGFKNNKRPGVNSFDSAVIVEGCLFSNNTSTIQLARFRDMALPVGGGAGFVFVNAKGLTVVVRNVTFSRNSALVNDSKNYIIKTNTRTAHSFFKPLPYLGGGLVVLFRSAAESNNAFVGNTVFDNNKATFGGGIFCSSTENAKGNEMEVRETRFVSNNASQAGGGIKISAFSLSTMKIFVKNCVFRENWSRIGGGTAVSVELLKGNSSLQMQFNNVTWEKNTAYVSAAAIALKTIKNALSINLEFTNCTVQQHSASEKVYTGAFVSSGINVKFTGTNVFRENHGAGAMEIQRGAVRIHSILNFIKNSGSKAGAVTLSENSKIVLFPGSELTFVQNHARGPGGAISIFTGSPYSLVREFNPNCFVTYSKEHTEPSKWKTKVSFLNNSATWKGAALYISTLQECLWHEEYPFYSAEKALRWKNAFEYRGNFLLPGENLKPLTGQEYDIATDTHHFHTTDVTEIDLSPGEKRKLDIYGYDELNNTIPTSVFLNEMVESKVGHKLQLDNNIRILPASNGLLPLTYSLTNENLYKEVANRTVHRFQLMDVSSTFKNTYFINITSIPCKPGFKFEGSVCTCDKQIEGLLRCSDDRRTVYLKEGYWGEVVNGRLETYVCPHRYCKCVPDGDLPGCVFDAKHVDNQCAHNRTGVLCGQCKQGLTVGLRRTECINCEASVWILVVCVVLVIAIVVIVIVLNPRLPSELRGPLFFFQALPFIFEPKSVKEPVPFVGDLFSFGGPFIYLPGSCIMEGMNNLSAVAMGYLVPFVTLIVFLTSYVLSSKFYLVRLKYSKNSCLQSFWLLTLFIYNYLAVTSFMLFNCRDVGGKWVFFYDGNVQCFEGTHLFLMIFALTVLALLVVPLPIVVILLTKGFWKTRPQYYSTLANGLSTQCSCWWAVDLLRRLLLMSAHVIVANWCARQVTLFLVCAVILALHSIFQPYKKKQVNMVETGYLLALCIMTIMQVLVDLDNKIETTAREMPINVVWFLLILAMAHSSFLLLNKALQVIRKKCRMGRRRKGYDQLDETTSVDVDQELIQRRTRLRII